jgi:hypothetical protein
VLHRLKVSTRSARESGLLMNPIVIELGEDGVMVNVYAPGAFEVECVSSLSRSFQVRSRSSSSALYLLVSSYVPYAPSLVSSSHADVVHSQWQDQRQAPPNSITLLFRLCRLEPVWRYLRCRCRGWPRNDRAHSEGHRCEPPSRRHTRVDGQQISYVWTRFITQ